MFGVGGGMLGDSPTFKITVGDKVGIEIKKVDNGRV
jgi:hypothetical protein